MLGLRKLVISAVITLFILVFPCQGRIYNVRDHGARGDKKGNDGPAIQKAINACFAAGGGRVYVPAGDYLCGGLRLKSNISFYLEAGATLWVSPEEKDYKDGNRFLYAEDENNITIEGRGTIHGTGQADLMRKKTDKKDFTRAF